jgi:diguanylate cyclase (GGDEF)-like protein
MVAKEENKSNIPENTLCGPWCKNFIGEDRSTTKQVSIRISSTYVVIGTLWILLSDKILSLLVRNKRVFANISMVKGWIYVSVTGVLIYLMVFCSLKRIKNTESKLIASCQSLTEANMELAAAYEQVAGSQSQLKSQYEKLVEYESELHYQAYNDQLTGAQNRLALIKNMNKIISLKGNTKLALLIVDIDNFKLINDTMGHSFGDYLLIQVTKRLESFKEGSCTIYRLSGDEFVILVESFEELSVVEKLAVKLLNSFKTRFEVDNRSVFITISMGISLYPESQGNWQKQGSFF